MLVGLLDEEKAPSAFEESLKKKKPFVSLIVENKLVPSSSIALAAAHEFGAPLVDIDLLEIDPDIIKLVKEELIKKHHALPLFKRGKRLAVAVSDPTNIQALDEIKFATGLTTDAIIVEEDKLTKNIEKAIEAAEGGLIGLLEDGDEIHIDVDKYILEANLSDEIIKERKEKFVPIKKKLTSKWLQQYRALVTNASNGAILKTDI